MLNCLLVYLHINVFIILLNRLSIDRNVSETKNLKSETARVKEELKKSNARKQEERKLLYDIRLVRDCCIVKMYY